MHEYSGVRPLYDDNAANPSAVTRDYVFDVDGGEGRAPLLSVFGGKFTTFRKLAEHALQKLAPFYPQMPGDWTRAAPLPGGDISMNFTLWLDRLRQRLAFLPPDVVLHYARQYGTRIDENARRRHRRCPIWAGISAAGFFSVRPSIYGAPNGRKPQRMCCDGAPSITCT